MNEIIQEMSKSDWKFESDKSDTELRILDWILYQVCISQQEQLKSELSQSLRFDLRRYRNDLQVQTTFYTPHIIDMKDWGEREMV